MTWFNKNTINLTENNWQESIYKAAEVIKAGGLVLFPSDTVYILAVDATNQVAVDKLISFKNRWAGKAISVAVTDIDMAKKYVQLNQNAKDIYRSLLPGPFTVISNGKQRVAKGVEAENGTLGIRIPDNRYIKKLVEIVGRPITATSANLSGRTPHYSVESLLNTLSLKKKNMLDLIVNGGKLPKNKPSTVIDITQPEVKVLRRGDLVTGKQKNLVSKSEKETVKIAEFILKKFFNQETRVTKPKPIVLALTGDLGCGKTVFSRAIGKTVGVREKITSPTFVIFNEYGINCKSSNHDHRLKKFLHFDLYRISNQYEYDEIKFFEQFTNDTISCIEWPENLGEKNLKKLKEMTEFYLIKFEYIDAQTREIQF